MTKRGERQRLWTDEEIIILRKKREAGKKATEIAEEMGRSHASILAKIDLLKIKIIHRRKAEARPTQRIRPPEVFILYGAGKSLLDVGKGECRFMFDKLCCAAVADGPYCKEHTRICYV